MCDFLFKEENGILQVKIKGEITLLQSNDLKEKIKEKLRELNTYQLILDLSEVPLVDSSGLGMFIALFKFVNENQGTVIYTGLNDYVYKVINYAKLDKIFTITEDVQTALKIIKNKWQN